VTTDLQAWCELLGEGWRDRIDVADFIRSNVRPYGGDGGFLAGPTPRTTALWTRLTAMFVGERARGCVRRRCAHAGVDHRARPRIHRPGPRAHRRPADRCPIAASHHAVRGAAHGGERASRLRLRGRPNGSGDLHQVPQDPQRRGLRRLHPADPRRRKASIITGLPDAYGRGRIIGDYRRVALYGVDALIAAERHDKAALDDQPGDADIIRDREELPSNCGPWTSSRRWPPGYGHDIGGPARTAREAVQWLYFAYLAATKEHNGAAMSLGRTSTFLDIYLERDLAHGVLDERGAQELIDDFVIKLRIIRFLRTPEYDELFSGDPTWVTESIGGISGDGRTLVTRTSFRYLHTLYNIGPAPEPNLTVLWSPACRKASNGSVPRSHWTPSAIQYENDDRGPGSSRSSPGAHCAACTARTPARGTCATALPPPPVPFSTRRPTSPGS
jgi:formate C-acetyltransferase